MMLKIENLTLGYGKKIIFSGINADENAGSFVALLGSNGRGKSTLLKVLAGLEGRAAVKSSASPIETCSSSEAPDSRILFNGRPIEDYTSKEISSLVSFVRPQGVRANNLSVKDMLGVSSYYRTGWAGKLNRQEEERISAALKQVGLEGFEGRNSASLSDGEYQRAAIAGALVQDTRIILLDEPTAFLDVAHKFLITRLLKNIAHSGKLIIFSTHDLQLALEICDKVWLMAMDGFYTGTPEALIENKIIDKMFSVPGLEFDKTIKSFTFTK